MYIEVFSSLHYHLKFQYLSSSVYIFQKRIVAYHPSLWNALPYSASNMSNSLDLTTYTSKQNPYLEIKVCNQKHFQNSCKNSSCKTKPIFRNLGLQTKTFSNIMQAFHLKHFRKQNQCILANKPHIQKSSFTKKNIFRNHAKHFSNAFQKTKPCRNHGLQTKAFSPKKNIFSTKKWIETNKIHT